MTPATPAVCSLSGHASPEHNVGRQASSAPTRGIPDPSHSSHPQNLGADPPFYSIPTGDLCLACDRTLTEPCLGRASYYLSGAHQVSEAYVHTGNFLWHSQWQYTNCAAPRSTVHPSALSYLHCHRGCSPPFGMEGGSDASPRPGSSRVPRPGIPCTLAPRGRQTPQALFLDVCMVARVRQGAWRPIGARDPLLLSWCGYRSPIRNNIFDARAREPTRLRLHLKWAI